MTNGYSVATATAPALQTMPGLGQPATRARAHRVALIHGNLPARQALGGLIGRATGLACVGFYCSIEQAVRGLSTAPADVLLLDLQLPRESPAEGVRRLRAAHARAAVLALTPDASDARVFDVLCNGAAGCLLYSTSPARLLMAIDDAASGGSPLSPEIARTLVALFQRTGPPPAAGGVTLTPRERALLSLMAQGRSYQAAADEMGISINTVRNYVRSIYEKLDVHSMGEAIAWAFRRGLI